MLQTLFTIPRFVAGVPLVYWLLAVWAIVSLVSVIRFAAKVGMARALRESWFTIAVTGGAIYILPNLMEPGGLPIRGYGVMLLLAVVAGVGLSVWRARRIGFDPEIILSLAMWLFLSGIVGARLFFVIEYWHTFVRGTPADTLKAVLSVTKGGLVVYGALLAGGAAMVAFIYRHRLPGFVLSDIIAPGVVLGMAIGRVGCFLNGCCYGGACQLPWAVQFPMGSPAFMDQASEGKLFLQGIRLRQPLSGAPIIDEVQPGSAAEKHGLAAGQRISSIEGRSIATGHDANLALLESYGSNRPFTIGIQGQPTLSTWQIEAPPRSNPIHPAQLYSAIDALLLCLFLLAWDPYRRREGELTALTLTLHPISRFLLEIIRVDESAVFGTSMSISQNISLGILAAAIVCWYAVLRRPPGLWQPRQA